MRPQHHAPLLAHALPRPQTLLGKLDGLRAHGAVEEAPRVHLRLLALQLRGVRSESPPRAQEVAALHLDHQPQREQRPLRRVAGEDVLPASGVGGGSRCGLGGSIAIAVSTAISIARRHGWLAFVELRHACGPHEKPQCVHVGAELLRVRGAMLALDVRGQRDERR